MNKSIKVDLATYEAVEDVKTTFSFKSFSECIHSMSVFFKNNNVSPRDSISNNFTVSLFETKSEIKTDIVDLKKFIYF